MRAGRRERGRGAPAVCPALHPAVGSLHLAVGCRGGSQNSIFRAAVTASTSRASHGHLPTVAGRLQPRVSSRQGRQSPPSLSCYVSSSNECILVNFGGNAASTQPLVSTLSLCLARTRRLHPSHPPSRPPPLLQEAHGRKILLARQGGAVYATDAHCFHMGGNLWEGDIEDIGGHACVICPLHRYKVGHTCVSPGAGPAAVLAGACRLAGPLCRGDIVDAGVLCCVAVCAADICMRCPRPGSLLSCRRRCTSMPTSSC